MNDQHCIYYALSKYLNTENNNFFYSEKLFHLLGGYNLSVTQKKNIAYPTLVINGNKFDFSLIEKYSGISISINDKFESADEFINTIIDRVNTGERQLVYSNCYFLPYDSANYQKNLDQHIIIVEFFNEATQDFLVSDYKVNNIKISKSDLLEACTRTINKKIQILEVNTLNKLDNSIITKNIINSIQINAESLLKKIETEFDKFLYLMENIRNSDELFKKLALNQLYKVLIHPNGPVVTRSIMADSCKALLSLQLYNKFLDLSLLWSQLSTDIIRYNLNKLDYEDIIESIINIKKHEIYVNEYLLQNLCEGII